MVVVFTSVCGAVETTHFRLGAQTGHDVYTSTVGMIDYFQRAVYRGSHDLLKFW